MTPIWEMSRYFSYFIYAHLSNIITITPNNWHLNCGTFFLSYYQWCLIIENKSMCATFIFQQLLHWAIRQLLHFGLSKVLSSLYCASKKYIWPGITLQKRVPLKVPYDTKLVRNDQGWQSDSYRISLESFRSFTYYTNQYRWKDLRSINPETSKHRLFISNCFELPSDWISQ